MSNETRSDSATPHPHENPGSTTGNGRRPAITLGVIVMCQLMVSVDSNVVNIALPEIQSALRMSSPALAWVFSAFSLAYGGLLLLGGRASDILGRRRMFVWGLSLVVVASALGGIATNQGILIAARALQGVGFAFAGPAALSLIAATFTEGQHRARALAVFSMVTGFGITLGLILGGVLTAASWRLVFFINVPIGIVTVVLAHVYLIETQKHPGKFDLPGAIVSTAGMVAIVYGLTRAASEGWSDALAWLSFLAGVALLAVFVLVERRARQPIVPLRVLGQRVRAGAYLSFVLLMITMGGTYILLSLYVQNALGFSSWQAGLAFLPMAVVQFFSARRAPKLIARFGRKPVLVTGVVLMGLEAIWLSTTTTSSNYLTGIVGPFILLGAGLGFAFVTLNMTVLGGLETRDMGAASGLLQAAQQIGLSLGVAILTSIYQSSQHGVDPGHAASAHGLATAALAAVVACVLALLVSVFVIEVPKHRTTGGKRAPFQSG